MKLSIVATLDRSCASVAKFDARALPLAAVAGDQIEAIPVNDGSLDDSLARAVESLW
jgi:hypothetical protein